MGGTLSQPARYGLADTLSELSDIAYKNDLGGYQIYHSDHKSLPSLTPPFIFFFSHHFPTPNTHTPGGGRLSKSALCVHDKGGLGVIKVYIKRPDAPEDVEPYRRRLVEIRSALAGIPNPHAIPYISIQQSDRFSAIYLQRQYLYANLSDRISSRPFLSLPEKKWIAYQLLLALQQCHGAGICHGDVKSENVLLTSWNWAVLADFAPYKPTLLPADNPANYSLFFDTSGKRKCYIAPERFIDSATTTTTAQAAAAAATVSSTTSTRQEEPLTPAMDIFSLGCVLAELFGEGRPLFDYSALLAYRKGTFDPTTHLDSILTDEDDNNNNKSLKMVIKSMIALNPQDRPTAVECLAKAEFPGYYETVLHSLFSRALTVGDVDGRAAVLESEYQDVKKKILFGEKDVEEEEGGKLKGGGKGKEDIEEKEEEALLHSDERAEDGSKQRKKSGGKRATTTGIAALLADVQAFAQQSKSSHQQQQHPRQRTSLEHEQQQQQQQQQYGTTTSPINKQRTSIISTSITTPSNNNQLVDGMVLLCVFACTLLRGTKLQNHKTRLVSLLCDMAAYCDDDVRLQRLVPFLIATVSEPMASAKCAALRGIVKILQMVEHLPPSEARIFTEYIFPSLSLLPTDGEAMVQIEYACSVTSLAVSGSDLLNKLQASRPTFNYDNEVGQLKAAIERVLHDFMVGPWPETRLAVLPEIGTLRVFLGRRDTADILLPLLLTLFNSQSWRVRGALYENFASVCPAIGPHGIMLIIMPFLDRMLGDTEPAVAAEAVGFLEKICRLGLLERRSIIKVTGTLCNRGVLKSNSTALRAAAIGFIAAAGEKLPPADIYAHLLPALQPYLDTEPLRYDCPQELTRAIKPVTIIKAPTVRSSSQDRTPPNHQPSTLSSTLSPLRSLPSSQRRSLDCSIPRPTGSVSSKTSPSKQQQHAYYSEDRGTKSMMMVLPRAAASYTVPISRQYLHSGTSYYSSALEESQFLLSPSTGSSSSSSSSIELGGPDLLVSRATRTIPKPLSLPAESRSSTNLPHRYSQHLHSNMTELGTLYPSMYQQQQQREGGGGGGGIGGDVAQAMKAAVSSELPTKATAATAATTNGGGAPSLTSSLSTPAAAPWYPRGSLVAHLAEHKKSVTRLAVAGCGAFFASASADGTVKIWDCRRLENDVSFKSCLTYDNHHHRHNSSSGSKGYSSKITALTACQEGYTIASGDGEGNVQVWRVECSTRMSSGGALVVERYACIVNSLSLGTTNNDDVSGAVLDLQSWGKSLLVSSTLRGGVSAWDLRTPNYNTNSNNNNNNNAAWNLKSTAGKNGYIERFGLDPSGSQNWLVTGSSRGILTLWDIRFRLPVMQWQHPGGMSINAMAIATAPPSRLGIINMTDHGGSGNPLVYVAAGDHSEVGLWDVARGKCLQVVKTSSVLGGGGIGGTALSSSEIPSPTNITTRRRQGVATIPLALTSPPVLPPRGTDVMGRAKALGINQLQSASSSAAAAASVARLGGGGCRALLPDGGGPLITAGSDRAIRCWDTGRLQQSYVVCAPPPPPPSSSSSISYAGGMVSGSATATLEGSSTFSQQDTVFDWPKYEYIQRDVGGVPVIEENCRLTRCSAAAAASRDVGEMEVFQSRLAWTERAAGAAHGAAVLDMVRVDTQDQALLVSCSVDGVIKAWM